MEDPRGGGGGRVEGGKHDLNLASRKAEEAGLFHELFKLLFLNILYFLWFFKSFL